MPISSLGEETVPLVLAQSQIWDAWSRTFLHTCCVAQMRKWPSSGFCFLQGCADVYLFIGRTNCIPCARAPANLRGGQKGNTCLRASCASRIRKWTSIVSVSCNRTYILRPLYSRNRKIGERKGDTWPRACCVSRIREGASGRFRLLSVGPGGCGCGSLLRTNLLYSLRLRLRNDKFRRGQRRRAVWATQIRDGFKADSQKAASLLLALQMGELPNF